MAKLSNDEIQLEKFYELINKFLISYTLRDVTKSDYEWLKEIFSECFPKMLEEEINELCREVKTNFDCMENFLKEASDSQNFEMRSQSWIYEKIKKILAEGDEEILYHLCRQDAILDNFNSWTLDFYNYMQFDKWNKDSFDDDDDKNTSAEKFYAGVPFINTASSGTNIRRDAINSGLKKSIMTQYQRIMQVDMAQINFRLNDMSNIAMNLSRNAALTGICGMILTSGLSLMKSGAKGTQLARLAIKTGATDGLRLALTGALKASAEKRIFPILTRATPMMALTATALIAIESSKLMLQYARGEIKCLEAFNQVSKISTAALCATGLGVKGAVIGSAAFAAIPVASPLVGAFIGELIGNAFGYGIGQKVHSKVKTLLFNAKNILYAHYKIFEHLASQSVTVKQKNRRLIYR